MALTNCVHELEGRCIPSNIGQCERCNEFKLDVDRCSNYDTYECVLKKDGTCPCSKYEPKIS